MAKKLTGYIAGVVITAIIVLFSVKVLNAADITTDTCPGSGCYTYGSDGQVSLAVQITGTWTGTITFKCSVDGETFVDCDVAPIGAAETFVTSTTGNGIWTRNELAGIKNFRVQFTTFSSGTAVVSVRALNK